MIIKAHEHDHAYNLARYLLATKENENAFVHELRDAATDDLTKALTDWEAIGRSKTKGSKILYHAYIRLREKESLREDQWQAVIDRLETKLGLTNTSRAIVGHNDAEKGLHLHVVWSRYDPITKKLAKLSNDHEHHHAIARQAEKEFGLEPTLPRGFDRRRKRLTDRQLRALKDRGIDREKLTKIMRAAWSSTESGEELKAMLSALGVEIKPGDKRDFVIQYKGLKMSPVRLLDDVIPADFRDRMNGVQFEEIAETAAEHKSTKRRAMHAGQLDLNLKPQERKTDQPTKRRAGNMSKPQIEANAAEVPVPKGFTKRKRRAPAPRPRPKFWFGDPGI